MSSISSLSFSPFSDVVAWPASPSPPPPPDFFWVRRCSCSWGTWTPLSVTLVRLFYSSFPGLPVDRVPHMRHPGPDRVAPVREPQLLHHPPRGRVVGHGEADDPVQA